MKKALIIISLLLLIPLFLYVENNSIQITRYNINNNTLSKNNKSFKIVHISDFHSKISIAKKVCKKISAENPDVIFITGDIIDRRKDENFIEVIEFSKQLSSIATTFFVSGNHEFSSGKYNLLKKELIKSGINVLSDEKIELNDTIIIAGLDDPEKYYRINYGGKKIKASEEMFFKEMEILLNDIDKDDLFLLLSHRPEFFNYYIKSNVDAVFSGHTHGGQIRIPFLGGIIAPNQGLFPKYDSGIYYENDTYLIVNRGIGNSIFPFRIFNRPEIVVLNLK